MKRILVVIIALGIGVAVAGVLATRGESTSASSSSNAKSAKKAETVSPKELTKAGWFCLDPGYWVHCVPPDVDPSAGPPVMTSLNFYTRDTEAANARFLGFEDLIRADLWNALEHHWPCDGKNSEYRRVPGDDLPAPGYFYCHHFNDNLEPPTR